MWWPEGSSYHLSAFSLAGRPGCLAIQYACSCKGARARYSELVPGSAVIHTDDIAWEHSRFGWAGLLIDGILMPAHHGQAVRYRPPRWDEHGREGSLQVPAGCPLLIIEGDGAWRRDVAHLIDTLIWVQADEREAGRRAAARAADRPAADLANRAVDGAPFDEDGWMAEEIPFNTAQRTWERAGIIVCGTPEVPYDPSTEIVIAPPPVTSWSRDDASGEQAEPCWGQGPGWPAQCRGAPPLIMGASRFLRKCPSITLDRRACTPSGQRPRARRIMNAVPWS